MEQTPKEYAIDIWLTYFERLPDGVYSDWALKLEAKRFSKIDVSNTIKALEEDAMLVKQSKRDWWNQVLTEIDNL